MKRRLFVLGGFAALAGCGGGSRPYSAGLAGGPGATPTPSPTPTPGATITDDFAISYRFTRNRWPDDILYVVKVTGKPGFTTPVTVSGVAMIPSVAGTEREFSLPPIPDDVPGYYLEVVPLWVTGTTPDGKTAKSSPSFLNTPSPGISVRESNSRVTALGSTQAYDLTLSTTIYGDEASNWEGPLTLALDRNPPEVEGNATLPLPEGATLDGLPASVTIAKTNYGANTQKFPLTLTLPGGTPEGKLYRFRVRAIDPRTGRSVSATVIKQLGDIPRLSIGASYKNTTPSGALVYELTLTPSFGFNQRVTGLRASAGPTLSLPIGTTYAVTPDAFDFSSGSSFAQLATLTIQLGGTPQGNFHTVQLDAQLGDGSSFTQTITVRIPAGG